jgi:SSS family solute:Na+ symporter
MTQKFYSIKNEAVIPKATIVTAIFALVIGFAAYFTGTSSHVFFDLESIPRTVTGGIDFDRIVPTLLTNHLPQAMLALILLLVLSASMSTLSSLVLVSSSAVAIDLNPMRLDKNSEKSKSVAMMRVLSGVFIIISYFISRFQLNFIVYLMSLSWGVVSGAFAAPYILGLYSKKITKAGAYAGLLSGMSIMIFLYFKLGESRSPLAASIAIIVPFFIVTAVSMFTAKPDKAILDKAFEGVK